MKVESNAKPNNFKLENINNRKIMICFFDNIIEKEEMFYYDMYRITLNNRTNLIEDIENNYETWLQFAKNHEYENLATEIRTKRDELLAETDWTQVTDTVLSIEKQKEYKIYRQELRDITEQDEFPYKVTFPKKPKE